MSSNCLICGVGGQGVVLASKLIAGAAAQKGMDVKTSETIGMAQRGGSVVSHVRIGVSQGSPLIPQGGADIILAMEPAEAVRCLKYLKKDGFIIVNPNAVQPVTASLSGMSYNCDEMLEYIAAKTSNYFVLNSAEAAQASGTEKAINTAMLGIACATGLLPLAADDFIAAFKLFISEKFLEINIKSFNYGKEAIKNLKNP